MERRAVLKCVIAVCAVFLGGNVMQPVGSALAGQNVSRARTTEQAIRSNDPDIVVNYVLRNQRTAGQGSLQDKVKLLKIMHVRWNNRVGYANLGLERTAEYERAMLNLLRGEDDVVVRGMLDELGGWSKLGSGLQHIVNPGLRITLDKALSR